MILCIYVPKMTRSVYGCERPYHVVLYSLPHSFNRDCGGKPFEDSLMVGVDTVDDVSGVLQCPPPRVDLAETGTQEGQKLLLADG